MSELFVYGTVWFWALVTVVSVLLLFAVEFEAVGWATMSIIATFGLLAWFGDFNIITVAREHPEQVVAFVGAYLLAGVVWSMCKWWFFVRNLRAEYEEEKRHFLDAHTIKGNVVPENLRREWARSTRSNRTPPKAREHKSRIMTWMAYWPWSMVWTLINDPVKKMFRWIYHQLQAVYQHIADSAFKGIENDLPKGKEEEALSEEHYR